MARLAKGPLLIAATFSSRINRLATHASTAPEPGLVNVVPGRVEMSVDLRHLRNDGLDALVATFTERAEAIGTRRGVEVAIDRFWTIAPTPFDPRVVGAIAKAAGPEAMRLWSGAGHDAKYAADAGPAGMIFVRSRGGLSHCEEELSEPDDIVAGVATLLTTVLALDTGA